MENFSNTSSFGNDINNSGKSSKQKIFVSFGVLVFLVLFYFLFLSAPFDFPAGTVFKLEQGMNLHSVSLKLKEEHFIRSRIIFEALVIIFGSGEKVISTNYYFESKLPVYKIAMRLAYGKHYMAPIWVTIPEGYNNKEIAQTFANKLENFDEAQFLLDAEKEEGYLFPDTYFVLATNNEKDVFLSMRKNFDRKIEPLLPEIAAFKKSERQIIIMASIIEKEAKGDNDRTIISGILWKRISLGMALQVDAAPQTYKNKGLPTDPIGNPGLLSIKAAIHPESSPYLYYLHDKNGNIHYAKTFAEHRKNISLYLK